jgi:hypothetical protein
MSYAPKNKLKKLLTINAGEIDLPLMNASPTQNTTGAGTSAAHIVRKIHSDIDGRNRQFVYTLYSDGSARTIEITRHCGDIARRTQRTYEEFHAVNSDVADMLHCLASRDTLPAGWY